jgi:hypothetical protein
MPPIGYALGGVDFDSLACVLKPAVDNDPSTEVAIRWTPEGSDEVKLLTEIRDELRRA